MPVPSVSDIIAILAVLISVRALMISSKLAKLELARDAADAAMSKKADLTAQLVKIDERKWRVIIRNVGQAAATNVRVIEADRSALLVSNEVRAKLPYELIEPGGQFQLIANVHLGMTSPKVPLRLNWDDASGKDKDKVVPVSI